MLDFIQEMINNFFERLFDLDFDPYDPLEFT